jgi:hypothetical protein
MPRREAGVHPPSHLKAGRRFAKAMEGGQNQAMSSEDLVRILIQGGLFLGAVVLGVFIAPENPVLVLGLCFGLFLFIGLGRLGRNMWILFPITSGFTGTIHFIPGGLSLFQIVCFLLVATSVYLLKADPTFRIRLGPAWIFWPFLLINIILAYNWIKGRDLGLNLLGSSKVGGKGYLGCILPFLGYVAAISMYRPGSLHDRRLPLYVLSGYIFDAAVFVVSTLIPAVAPYVFRFYDAVNVEAFQAVGVSQTAAISEGFVLRFHKCGQLAYVLAAALQVYLPFSRWWGLPNILIGPPLFILATLLSLISGFRNFLVRFALVTVIGVWQSFRIFSLFLVLPVVLGVAVLCVGQGNLFDLPLVVQRTLVFLPGKWDRAMAKAAEESFDFREEIRRVYFSEFFRKDNFLGEGFLFARDDLEFSQEQYWRKVGYQRVEDKDAPIRGFITRRQHHEGVVNIHHLTGHAGFLVWAVFGFLALIQCGRYLLRTPLRPETVSGHFGATLTVVMVLTYWFLFGSLKEAAGETLSYLFCLTAALTLARQRIPQNVPAEVPPPFAMPAPVMPWQHPRSP